MFTSPKFAATRPPAPAPKVGVFHVTVSDGFGDYTHEVTTAGRAAAWNAAATAHRRLFGLAPYTSLTCLGLVEKRPTLTF